MIMLDRLKRWVKQDNQGLARILRRLYYAGRYFEIPSVPVFHRALYRIHMAAAGLIGWFLRVFYYTPMFKARLSGPSPRLYIYGGMPLVTGSLKLTIGEASRISAATTFTGRWCSESEPELRIGKNVGIGWQTTIACGSKVIIGDNVRIAGRSLLAGYPGHPLDAADRAAGLPDRDEQIGDIILEDDVWLATGVMVSAGVTIGTGTIVATGSIVTKDLPPHVLAAGAPARVIRQLDPGDDHTLREAAA
jgi:acetyltransferase-like isoleucine patch superfamily enzyme